VVYWLSLVAVVALTITLVFRFKERALYFLFLVTYTQSFVIPFLYTNGVIGRDVARSMVLFKEFLLLELFVVSVVILFSRFRRPWPRPLRPLLFFTAYCIFRFVVGVVFLGDNLGQELFKLRMICYPLEILMVVMVFTALKPEFGERFLRDITYVLSILAVVAIALFLWAPADFWLEHANIAAYDLEVKGETDADLLPEKGISLTSEGRAFFDFLSPFRATGTFGDALTLGFSMAVPVLLLLFHFRKSLTSALMLAASAGAMFFSLSRSVWLFCCIVGAYVLLRRRRYGLILLLGVLALTPFLLWAPLADFAAYSISDLSRTNPGNEHAEGILWFYSRGFTDSGNILGKGMADEVQAIPESGYAFLLEHFGVLAYIAFLWFCISLYRQLRKDQSHTTSMPTLGQAITLGIFVVMHFSQYPFAFTEFISLWYIIGLCLSIYLLPRENHDHNPIGTNRQDLLGEILPSES